MKSYFQLISRPSGQSSGFSTDIALHILTSSGKREFNLSNLPLKYFYILFEHFLDRSCNFRKSQKLFLLLIFVSICITCYNCQLINGFYALKGQ